MIEFIGMMTICDLPGTAGTAENVAAVRSLVDEFAAVQGVTVRKAEVSSSGASLSCSVTFTCRTTDEEFCAKIDNEVTENFVSFLKKRGYAANVSYRGRGRYWTKEVW
jgi:hypothetical protein